MGFGGSSSPVSDYYMETQARCLAELLMSLGVREIHLIAHDFGGPVSVLFSRLFPHLRIVKLVLMATNTFVDTPIPGPLRAARIPLVGRLIIKILAGTEFGFRQIYQNGVKNKEQFSWADFSVHISRRNLYYTYRIFHRSLASLEHNYAGVQKHLKMISSPVLVVWGDSDPFFPVSVGVRLRDEIMDASMLTYNNTGHFIPEERSEQLARDLDQFFATAHGSFSRPLS
jgi:pimeloyl-ACP methyl ester carboxylesterase